MKEFFDDIKSIIKENKEEKEVDLFEEKTFKKEIIQEEKELKKEIFKENKKEITLIRIILLIIFLIFIIILGILFINRNNISKSIQKFMDNSIEKSSDIFDKYKNILPNITNYTKINCKDNYTANYQGEYTMNNQRFKESLSLKKDGSYSRIENENISSGKYTINNNIILVNEESPTNWNSSYKVSDDCKTLTRNSNDGTTIILNID